TSSIRQTCKQYTRVSPRVFHPHCVKYINLFSQNMPKARKVKPPPKEKVCHPYSRKAAYLASQEIRLCKKGRQKIEKATRLNNIGEKLLWFQSQLDPDKIEFTKQDACRIIER
ncbi:hypothetical protein UPYG_G00050470, partial [Umbra pygmaea]